MFIVIEIAKSLRVCNCYGPFDSIDEAFEFIVLNSINNQTNCWLISKLLPVQRKEKENEISDDDIDKVTGKET